MRVSAWSERLMQLSERAEAILQETESRSGQPGPDMNLPQAVSMRHGSHVISSVAFKMLADLLKEFRDLESELVHHNEDLMFFRTMVDQSSDGIYVVNSETAQFLEANVSGCALLEYSIGELREMTVMDVDVKLPDRETWDRFASEVRSKGRSYFETQVVAKSGRRLEVELTLSYSRLGELPYIIASLRDLSHRKELEMKNRSQSDRLRAVLNSLPDLCFVLNEDGLYVEVLAEKPNLLYRSPDELLNKRLHDVMPKSKADEFLRVIHATLRANACQAHEYELELPGGPRRFEGRVSPLRETVNGRRAVVWLSKNISDAGL